MTKNAMLLPLGPFLQAAPLQLCGAALNAHLMLCVTAGIKAQLEGSCLRERFPRVRAWLYCLCTALLACSCYNSVCYCRALLLARSRLNARAVPWANLLVLRGVLAPVRHSYNPQLPVWHPSQGRYSSETAKQ